MYVQPQRSYRLSSPRSSPVDPRPFWRAAPARRGVGSPDYSDASFGQKATAGLVSGASIGVATAVSTGSKIAGGVAGALAAIAPFTGPAAPFIALAAGLVAVLTPVFNRGCGPSCTQATAIANQAADVLIKVDKEYWSQPVRTRASQLAALGLIDDVIAQLNQMCGNPALGDAGRRCISERTVRGGTAPWCPTSTGCDWFTVHRDPIANDTGVVDDDPVTSALSSVGLGPSTQIFGIPLSSLVIPGGLLLLALSMGDD